MLDLYLTLATLAFFGLTFAFVAGCDHVVRSWPWPSTSSPGRCSPWASSSTSSTRCSGPSAS